MNKFTLRKLILSLLLSFSINNLNCMQASDIEPDSDLSVQDYELEIESKINYLYIRKIVEAIDDSINLSDLNKCISLMTLHAIEHSWNEDDKDQTEKIQQTLSYLADLMVRKIKDYKLAQYDEMDPIRLLFDKGLNVYENIQTSLSVDDEIQELCPLLTLPNEILFTIFNYCINEYIDSINKVSLTMNNLSVLENKQRQDFSDFLEKNILNCKFHQDVHGAIKFIAIIIQVNKCFYSFGKELIAGLQAEISQELFYEQCVKMIQQNQEDLIQFLLRMNKIDAKCCFKRFGNSDLNFLGLFVLMICNEKSLTWTAGDIIKKLIYRGSELKYSKMSNKTVLFFAVERKFEKFAIFLVNTAPSMALDKSALHMALAFNMQALINVMKENGAIIEPEDLEMAQEFARKIETRNSAILNYPMQPLAGSRCIVC